MACAPRRDPRPSATSPASSSTGTARPGLEPRRPLASGAASTHRPGADPPAPGAVPRRRRAPGPLARRPARQRPRRRCRSGRRRRRHSDESEQPFAAGENQVEWTSTSTTPRCGGRAPSASSRSTTSPSRCRSTSEVSDRGPAHGLRQVDVGAGLLGQRRADLPQGRQLAARRGRATGRRHRRRSAATSVAASRPRPVPRPRPHRRPESYDAADELGMLLWQDFPLQWGYARTFRAQASTGPRGVDPLAHHPSIALWCAHDDPGATELDGEPTRCPSVRRRSRPATADVEPQRARPLGEAGVREADPSRHVVAHSGVAPPPAPARRHRQPPLVRLAPWRPGPRRVRRAPCPGWSASSVSSAPIRYRIRAIHRRHPQRVARPRLGPLGRARLRASVFERHFPPSDSTPSRRGAPPRSTTRRTSSNQIEDTAPTQVPPDRRVLLLHTQRLGP